MRFRIPDKFMPTANRIKIIVISCYLALYLMMFTYTKVTGQTPPQSLTTVVYSNITSSSTLDGCVANYPCIDNRSQFSRQSSTSSYRAFGTGTWSVDMQWADVTPTVWTSFGSTAQVNQSSPSSGIGYGIGPASIQKPYHDYIRFVITGSATIMNYTGTRQFWWLPSVASIAFPLTAAQGGTYGVVYVDQLASPLSAICTNASAAGLTILVTVNQIVSSNLTCSVPMAFTSSGIIKPASGVNVIVSGKNLCGAMQECYDLSASGSSGITFSSPPAVNTPQNYGAKEDGSTDDTVAFQTCINVSVNTGTPCSGQAGTYLLNTASGGVIINLLNSSVSGCVSGGINVCTPGFIGQGRDVTYLKTTVAGDLLHAVSTTDGFPAFRFENFTLVGPDSAHSGAISGNGLYVSTNAFLSVTNVSASGFFGSGKSAFWFDTVEGGSLTNVTASLSDTGIKFTNAANLTTCTLCSASNNYSYGQYINSSVLSLINASAQSNGCTGFYLTGTNSSNYQMYVENNNTSGAGSGCYDIDLETNTSSNNFSVTLQGNSTKMYLNGTVQYNRFSSGSGISGSQGTVFVNTPSTALYNDWGNWDGSAISGSIGYDYGLRTGCSPGSLSSNQTSITGSYCNQWIGNNGSATTIQTLPSTAVNPYGFHIYLLFFDGNTSIGNSGNIRTPGYATTYGPLISNTWYCFTVTGNQWELGCGAN